LGVRIVETYGDLKTEVALWLDREDVATYIQNWVRLAEVDIYRDLRSDDNEFIATYTPTAWGIEGLPTSGAWTTGEFLLLPPNFREMTLVTWNGFPLDQVSKARILQDEANFRNSETTKFAISGRRIRFSLAIAEDPLEWLTDDVLEYTYYGVESLNATPTWQVAVNPVENPVIEDILPEALTQTDANTTRMLQRNPDIYLNGVLYYAALFLKYDADAQKYGTLFRGALDALKMESENRAFSGSTSQISSVYSD
jgi:hypothetical protein